MVTHIIKVAYRQNVTGACDIAIIKDGDDILSYIHVSPNGVVDTNEVFRPSENLTKYKDINQFFDDIRYQLFIRFTEENQRKCLS